VSVEYARVLSIPISFLRGRLSVKVRARSRRCKSCLGDDAVTRGTHVGIEMSLAMSSFYTPSTTSIGVDRLAWRNYKLGAV